MSLEAFLLKQSLRSGMDELVTRELEVEPGADAMRIAERLGDGPYTPELVQESLDRIASGASTRKDPPR